MEEKLLELIMNIYINSKYTEMYNNKVKDFNLHVEINDDISFNILIDFNNKYFDKYKIILFENALIYALYTNNKEYLNHLKENENKDPLNSNLLFQTMTTKLAYKNLYNKYINNINYDKKIKDKYFNIFDKYKYMDEKNIETITSLYRKILLNYLNKYSMEDTEIILDNFINSNILDKDFINNSNGIININNLPYYKYMITKLIFSDNYLHLKSLEKEEYDSMNDYSKNELDYDEDDYEYDFEEKNLEKEDELLTEIDNKILDYIETSLTNKTLILPADEELRLNIYAKFIAYNLYLCNFKYDFENIKEDTDTIKKLKKINPVYMLDLN